MNGFNLSLWTLPELVTACVCWGVWLVSFTVQTHDPKMRRQIRRHRSITLLVNLMVSLQFLTHAGLLPAGQTLWWMYLVVVCVAPPELRYNRASRGLPIAPPERAYWVASVVCLIALIVFPAAFVGPDRIGAFGLPQASTLLGSLALVLLEIGTTIWSLSQRTPQNSSVQASSMLAWSIFSLTALLEQLNLAGLIGVPPVLWLGILVLTLEFSRVLQAQQATLIQDLAQANTELKTLSADLERRVEARTLDWQVLALFDPLTGLPNRPNGEQFLANTLLAAERSGRELAVLMIDLDRFKDINDTAGHLVGDAILRRVAVRFQAHVPEGCLLARFGGDEFLLVVPEIAGAGNRKFVPGQTLQNAERLCENLLESLSEPITFNRTEFYLEASIGISLYPQHGTDSTRLQSLADIAMYRAKRQRLGHRSYDTQLDTAITKRIAIERAMRQALEDGFETAFHLEYQPIIELRTGKIVSVEALLRWDNPNLRLGPAEFIPIAEDAGMIVPLGHWVLIEACRQAAIWQREGLPNAHIAVNVSSQQFNRPDFVERIKDALELTGLRPESLTLELLESVLVEHFDRAAAKIAQLRALGVKIALDDFGTGYSSLSYLQHLNFDALKIDRSFTKMLGVINRPRALVAAMQSIAHEFGMITIAEGIETPDQATELEILGCGYGQGFLYSQALPAEQFTVLLRQGKISRQRVN